jgi:hypothetical protein
VKKLAAMAILAFGLFAGCGGASCKTACSKIYGECKMTVSTLTEEQCVANCELEEKNDPAGTEAGLKCVDKAACDVNALTACFL